MVLELNFALKACAPKATKGNSPHWQGQRNMTITAIGEGIWKAQRTTSEAKAARMRNATRNTAHRTQRQ